MQSDGDFKVWYNQHSDCAGAPSWVSGSIVIDNKGQEDIDQIKADLNKITNNGKNVRNIFDNPYYINDAMQDKLIAQEKLLNN